MRFLLILSVFFLLSFTTVLSANYNYCYQETANISTDCGSLNTGNYAFYDKYFIVNYSKPVFSNQYGSYWKFKHGNPSIIENISIPVSCWNYNNVSLKINSVYENTNFQRFSSGECFDGTNWNLISLNMTSANDGMVGGGYCGLINLIDGQFYSHATYVVGLGCTLNWANGFDLTNGSVYEEAMNWNITVPPLYVVDFSQLNYIRQFGTIISNHNRCYDTITLLHNITYIIKIDNNQSTVLVNAYEPCEYGCDNSTNTCNVAPSQEYTTYGLYLLGIIIAILLILILIKVLSR